MTNTLSIDDNGAVTYGNRIVGEFNDGVLTLNAGWCRLAGLGFKIEGDSDDRRKVLLDRSNGGRAPEKAPRVRKAPEVDPQQQTLPAGDEDWEKKPEQKVTNEPGPVREPEPAMSSISGSGSEGWGVQDEPDPKYDF